MKRRMALMLTALGALAGGCGTSTGELVPAGTDATGPGFRPIDFARSHTVVVHVSTIGPFFSEMHDAEAGTVALDYGPGARLEAPVGPDGRAYFEVDDDAELVSATAHVPGHALNSAFGFPADAEELALYVRPLVNDAVPLEGTALGMTDTHNGLELGATVPSSTWASASGDTFSLDVVRDRPFWLVAREVDYLAAPAGTTLTPIRGWAVAEHEAVAAPGTITVDFGTSVVPTALAGSFTLEALPEDSPFREETAVAVVSSWGPEVWSAAPIGRSTETAMNADHSRCDFNYEYVSVPGVRSSNTQYRLWRGSLTSVVRVSGLAEADPGALPFLDLPSLQSASKEALHATLALELPDGARPVLLVSKGDQVIWTMFAPPDSTSFALPLPPSSFGDAPGEELTGLKGSLYAVTGDIRSPWWDTWAGPDTVTFE